jgi:hypothetical protein
MAQSKTWWTSKTVWINLLALCGSIALAFGVDEASWAEISTTTLAVVNLGLRFITNSSLTAN